MITIENSQLIINHDDGTAWIKTRLNKRADAYVSEWLPRILTENLGHSLEKLLTAEFSWLGAEQKANARRAISEAPPERVESRFRKIVDQMVSASADTHLPPTANISFQRTLRIPYDGRTYPLPPDIGNLFIRKMEPHAEKLPAAWSALGGVLMPMYRSDAMGLRFQSRWPTAIKIGIGPVNAINGAAWSQGLHRIPQGYVVLPGQIRLDECCIAPGITRQFIAPRLSRSKRNGGILADVLRRFMAPRLWNECRVDKKLTEYIMGGIQIEAFPLLPEPFFDTMIRKTLPKTAESLIIDYLKTTFKKPVDPNPVDYGPILKFHLDGLPLSWHLSKKMKKQNLISDPWDAADWDLSHSSRIWVQLVENSVWKALTGRPPLSKPLKNGVFEAAGIPWFDHYRDDSNPPEASEVLLQLHAAVTLAHEQMEQATAP